MNAAVEFNNRLPLKDIAELIVACPDIRVMVRGEPGIGKSSLGGMLQKMTGYPLTYIDCASLELGDLSIPAVDKELRVSEQFPMKRLNLHTGGPVILVLDEFPKAPVGVQNMLHPLLESNAPRLGDRYLPSGSYVVMTGNLSTDGVGDVLKAHTRSRIVEVECDKGGTDVWIPWAIEQEGIAPELIAWVDQTPEVLASYRDAGNEDNMYIYNPKRPNTAYVTPRTLERAGKIVSVRGRMNQRTLAAALRGCLGDAAAKSLLSFMAFADQIPRFEQIIAAPLTTPVPTSAGACCLVAFGAIQKMTQPAMTPFMQYIERMQTEWQSVFCVNIAKTPSKQSIAFSCRAFAEWVGRNQDLL